MKATGPHASNPDSTEITITETYSLDVLSELSRATTVYHEAAPDCVEFAREQYLRALRNYRATKTTGAPGLA